MAENLFENELKEIESDKQRLAFDIDRLIEAGKQSRVVIAELNSKISEFEWLLGEEKSRREQCEKQLQEKAQDIGRLQDDFQKLNHNYDESQWYLGEEKSRSEQLKWKVSDLETRIAELERKSKEL
jgi:chromosome segregation ATPase